MTDDAGSCLLLRLTSGAAIVLPESTLYHWLASGYFAGIVLPRTQVSATWIARDEDALLSRAR